MNPFPFYDQAKNRFLSLKPTLSPEHALIGVSPFNSYFSQENLEKMIAWGFRNFKDIHIFIPDQIYTYTFQALGYSQEKANKKTKRQDHYLRNKVIKAFLNNGVCEEEIEKRIIFLSHLWLNKDYEDLYNKCLEFFETKEFFKEGCLSTSKWILDSKGISKASLSKEVLNIAVKYFLAELPLFLNTPQILKISSSNFVYKDIPEFLEILYERHFFVAPTQNFLRMVIDT